MRQYLSAAAAFLLALLSTPSPALTVGDGGSIICDPGKQEVYWEEESGMEEAFRRILVMHYPEFRAALLHEPARKRSELLDDGTGGTNIPWRVLLRANGEGYGGYRYLTMTTTPDLGFGYDGRPVTALIVGLSVYWPVCALTATVEDWLKQAKEQAAP